MSTFPSRPERASTAGNSRVPSAVKDDFSVSRFRRSPHRWPVRSRPGGRGPGVALGGARRPQRWPQKGDRQQPATTSQRRAGRPEGHASVPSLQRRPSTVTASRAISAASNGRDASAARARRRSSSRVSKSSRSVIAELRSKTVKKASEPRPRSRRRAPGRPRELRRVEPRDVPEGEQGPVSGSSLASAFARSRSPTRAAGSTP